MVYINIYYNYNCDNISSIKDVTIITCCVNSNQFNSRMAFFFQCIVYIAKTKKLKINLEEKKRKEKKITVLQVKHFQQTSNIADFFFFSWYTPLF